MLSWNENAAVCFLSVLRDPSIVMYLMSILKPMRRDFVEGEARDWHKSLRISQKERWERVAKLSKERKFSQMNSSVPITCTLPFDGGMWRNSKKLLKMVRYFRKGFIRKITDAYYDDQGYQVLKTGEEQISRKIKIVNLVNDEGQDGMRFRYYHSIGEIEDALDTLITYETYPEPAWEWEKFPYITPDQSGRLNDAFIVIEN